ncbi:MAG: ABC-2 family transporter protein [Candidatus Roizmanbacteria bacterium]|nr:MAG: ABC-2 family transporter protein [Candidatus Roizmanbacteria bacterium]
MKKYWLFFKANVDFYFVYRLSFILWRVRNILGFLIIYFLWSSIYSGKTVVFNYTQEQMITYVLAISFTNALIIASRTTDIASEIVSGDIINYLLRPVSFFSLVITKELADKIVNGIAAVIEIVLLVLIFQPHIFIQQNLSVYPFVFAALLIGAAITFFLSLSLSFIAFWTSEVWAPRFIYFVLISMFAGTFFPLDILPPLLYNFLLATPFPYLIYLPTKIYLTGISGDNIKLLGIGIIWAVVFYFVAKKIWQKGLMEFSFYGK